MTYTRLYLQNSLITNKVVKLDHNHSRRTLQHFIKNDSLGLNTITAYSQREITSKEKDNSDGRKTILAVHITGISKEIFKSN